MGFLEVKRIYVEKKEGFSVESAGVLHDLHNKLGLKNIEGIRIIHRYDIEGIAKTAFERAVNTVFCEPSVDNTYNELPNLRENQKVFAISLVEGQFDQRAHSCAECIQMMTGAERPKVKYAKVYIITNDISDDDLNAVKKYLINPVENTEVTLDKYNTLKIDYETPSFPETLTEFNELDKARLNEFLDEYSLAMDYNDLKFCQDYFKSENRPPTITEIRVIDTYWSDHCRHTTFLTNLKNIEIKDENVKKSYENYLKIRDELYNNKEKPVTLMDIATIGAKKLQQDGYLDSLDKSDEVNACSVKIKVDVDGKDEDWLLMFKNETHNHPTEIEPFGGASTCLGGAIRDPLSGRSYVFAAMRITGASDPLTPFDKTLKGKLPQYKITRTAAAGYSSYGNQIGATTGHVTELYHAGYAAKRMELGAVLAAVKEEYVRRETPAPGDIVILLGGETGRDGCGGATGSSKSHTVSSLTACSAEVQKGDPPLERRIVRLFRNPDATRKIKRCNDFGAGGVSVAIGELADGLKINLDAVPTKYKGLDATELAISESQERMAVVVEAADMYEFIKLADNENLNAVKVAVVTSNPYMVIEKDDKVVVNLSRKFLNSNGAKKFNDINVKQLTCEPYFTRENTIDNWKEHLSDLNICSQKGLVEYFDASAGASTVLMPLGGARQLTPSSTLAVKIPVQNKETNTTALMGWGYNPYLAQQSPYLAAKLSVIESIARIIAAGGSLSQCWLTFQEYYERLGSDPLRWGKPFSALLGTLEAQMAFKCGSIGGKDSMSGTFEDIDVPPTLVSFAVSTAKADKIVSNEFKKAGSKVILLSPYVNNNKQKIYDQPDFKKVKAVFDAVESLINTKKAAAVYPIGFGGISEALSKMCFGNKIGFRFTRKIDNDILFNPVYGSFLIELNENVTTEMQIGETISEYQIENTDGVIYPLFDMENSFTNKLEEVFPTKVDMQKSKIVMPAHDDINIVYSEGLKTIRTGGMNAKPRVLIPIFPGTNSEYDIAKAVQKAGGSPKIFIIKNRKPQDITQSAAEMASAIAGSQILILPGGFGGGEEPDNSGKFMAAFLKNSSIAEQIDQLLYRNDGLILGINSGFQALLKLGLLENGKITNKENDAFLTLNPIGRHQSKIVNTKVVSNLSPWLALSDVGYINTVPVSYGEGRFMADDAAIKRFIKNGQIATQYVDFYGNPTMDINFNPAQSVFAIEGLSSPDGRILGKSTHPERIGTDIAKNVPSAKDGKRYPNLRIFEAGIRYFTD